MRLWGSTTTKRSATSIVPENVDVEKMNTRTEYDIEIEESRGRPLTRTGGCKRLGKLATYYLMCQMIMFQ